MADLDPRYQSAACLESCCRAHRVSDFRKLAEAPSPHLLKQKSSALLLISDGVESGCVYERGRLCAGFLVGLGHPKVSTMEFCWQLFVVGGGVRWFQEVILGPLNLLSLQRVGLDADGLEVCLGPSCSVVDFATLHSREEAVIAKFADGEDVGLRLDTACVAAERVWLSGTTSLRTVRTMISRV